MAMYQGIDLSRFKKISGDSKSSTLRHSKGHEIKIAHGGLSPAMRDQINQMPVHLSEEGDVPAPIPQPSVSPEQMSAENAATEPAPQAPEPAPAPVQSAPQQPAAQAPAEQQAPTPRPMTVEQDASARNMDDANFEQDVHMGHVHPKTYADLFANNYSYDANGKEIKTPRSTLSKIGTIFGLLIGGAGAGLSHQPNKLLEMMDKEIERDLEAQKKSNENSQNWYRLHQAQEMQKYNIQKTKAEVVGNQSAALSNLADTGLTRAKMKAAGLPDNGLGEAQNSLLKKIVDINAEAGAKNKMRITAVDDLQKTTNKLPPGPTKTAAQSALDNSIRPGVAAAVMQTNHQAAQKVNAAKTAVGQPPPEAPKAVNLSKMNQMIDAGKNKEAIGIAPQSAKGEISSSEASKVQQEASDAESNLVARKLYNQAFTKLYNHPIKSLDKNFYNKEIAILGPLVAREAAGRYVTAEAQQQLLGMMPSYEDFKTGREGTAKDKYNNTMAYFDGEDSKLTTLNRYPQLRNKQSELPSPFSKSSRVAPVEGTTGTFLGKPVVYKNGKWTHKT